MMPIISLGSFAPIVLGLMGVLMVVLRAGASQVFFDVVGRFQAKRLIKDADTQMTVFNALILDSISNIQEAGQAFGDTIDAFVESILPSTIAIADATIELEKFVSAGEDFEGLKEDVMELGASFGYTGDQALQAASKMAQLASVLGEGQTAVGAQLGFEFGLISGMETEKAMQRLVNLNQQIHFMTRNTENMTDAEEKGLHIRQNTLRVLDQLNTIENRSAATMEQVTFVMNQFASQANLTGESIAFMAAQSALLIEAGEEQGKGGRAIRAVYSRLGADTSGAATALQDLGIQTHNANGALKPLSDILGQLNQKWPEMNKGQQQNITQLVAGNRHYTRLIKLIEGYDRILQLQFEGEMALMPALEEVDIRLQSNINSYREAQANLTNYRAELGDNLLPALTKVTEKQVFFTQSLSDLSQVSETATTLVYGFAQGFKDVGGPLINVFLMFQSLTVATNTLASVTRALQGEEIVLATAYGRGGQALVEYSQKLTQINAVRANEIKSVRDQYNEIAKINYLQLKANQATIKDELRIQKIKKDAILDTKIEIQAKKDEIIAEQFSSQRKVRTLKLSKSINEERKRSEFVILKLKEAIHDLEKEERQYNAALLESIQTTKIAGDENAKYLLTQSDRKQKSLEEESNKQAALAASMMGVAGATAAAGGALMLFSQNQEMMTAGMIVSSLSVATMTASQLKNAGAFKFAANALKIGEKQMLKTIGITEVLRYEIDLNTATYLGEANAININSEALLRGQKVRNDNLTSTKMNWATFAKTVGIVSVALLGVVAITKLISKETKKATDAMDKYKGGVVDVTIAMEKAGDTSLTIADVNDKITQTQLDINVAMLQGDKIGQENLRTSLDTLATYEAILTLKERDALLELDTANDENLKTIFNTLQDIDELNRKFGVDENGFVNLFAGEGDGILGSGAQLGRRFASEFNPFNDVNKDAQDLYQTLEDISLINPKYKTLIDQLLDGTLKLEGLEDLQVLIDSMTKEDEDGSGVLEAQSWELATEALQKFSNAREELFYGMSANNLTGDLIKQVQQTGVENLIANTEVIMTNNFNGMTTRQVADEILAQISQGAGGLGININLNTV